MYSYLHVYNAHVVHCTLNMYCIVIAPNIELSYIHMTISIHGNRTLANKVQIERERNPFPPPCHNEQINSVYSIHVYLLCR